MSAQHCSNCRFQYTEVCPEQFGNTVCGKYVAKQESAYQPQRKKQTLPKPNKKYGRVMSVAITLPDTRPVKLRNGQKLYYREGETIESGIAFQTGQDSFWFLTKGIKQEYDYSVIGEKLFFSRKGAEKNSK